MAVFCVSPGVAALPARRRPPQFAALGGRAGRVSARGPLQRGARCAARFRVAPSAASSDSEGASPAGGAGAQLQDANGVQTALNEAVAQEDYARASQCVPCARRQLPCGACCALCAALRRARDRRLRDRLRTLVGEWVGPTDWFGLGVPRWLADRTERLGFRFPTEARARGRTLHAAASALTA